MPAEMIASYAILKKAAALANNAGGRLSAEKKTLIVKACDEVLEGAHDAMFPLHVWMTGSGTQFNMNVNEVISNRSSQIAGERLGSKRPVHPNDDVNMSQSTNDTFPSAMCIAAATGVVKKLIPAIENLKQGLDEKAAQSSSIREDRAHSPAGRHAADARSGVLGICDHAWRQRRAAQGVARGRVSARHRRNGGRTGLNAAPGFDKAVAGEIAKLTGLPFATAAEQVRGAGRA